MAHDLPLAGAAAADGDGGSASGATTVNDSASISAAEFNLRTKRQHSRKELARR
jgi:hypothetical protein